MLTGREPNAICIHMNVAWSIYPGANGGGSGDLVQGVNDALSKGLGNLGSGAGNPLGMLAAIGGLVAGGIRGIDRLGSRFEWYRKFKEGCSSKWEAIKGKTKSLFGMSDDAAKAASSVSDDVAKGAARAVESAGDDTARALSRTASGAVDDATVAAGGVARNAARGAASVADDVARAGGRSLVESGAVAVGRAGSKVLPVVGVAIDGAFRYQDYKATEGRYDSAVEAHKQGLMSDTQFADEQHARNAGHSRNAAGMAGGLIGASLAAGAVGAGIGATGMGVGAIPGFVIGLGVGVVGYYVGSKTGETVSDAAWGEPPSYSKTADTLARNSANADLSGSVNSHDAGKAWAATRSNSTYPTSDQAVTAPGTVTSPAEVAKFNQAMAGSAAAPAPAAAGTATPSVRGLARGKSSSLDPRLRSSQIGLS